jgi:mRNA interferase MazF
MPFDFGDVLLVPFPFTNLAASKRRPAVVVSNRAYSMVRQDVVIMAVTSQFRADPNLIETPVTQWQSAGLLKPSTIKPVFATLEQALVLRRLGSLENADLVALKGAIGHILG